MLCNETTENSYAFWIVWGKSLIYENNNNNNNNKARNHWFLEAFKLIKIN